MPLSWTELVEAGQQGGRGKRLAIDRDGIAALEIDLDNCRLVRRILWRDRSLVDIFGRLDARILEHLPLGR
jgi:hypothetical protein